MKSLAQTFFAVAGLVFLGGLAIAQEPQTISPNTPEGRQAIAELRNAKSIDAGNARSFSAEDNSVDHYYARKAREVDQLLRQLENGQSISKAKMDKALNNERAETYAPGY